MSRAISTTDHQTIRQWIEARNGHPSVVRATGSNRPGQAGLLRIDFDKPDDALDEVTWDEFFETFDENQLAFLYQEKTASGRKSRFNKFVSRASASTGDEEPDETSMRVSDEGSTSASRPRVSALSQEEAEEIDEEDALEDDEDLRDDENTR